jgi:hypothetical protein
MARVNVEKLRLDTADAPYGQPLRPLTAGDRVYLLDGPQLRRDGQWWELAGTALGIGWARAITNGGVPTLTPYSPDCPTGNSLTAADLARLSSLERLACFGGRQLTVVADVGCNRGAIDGGTGGAWFLDSQYWCQIGGDGMWVYGPAITGIQDFSGGTQPVMGSYRLVGHFDDPAAQGCAWFGIGVSLDMPVPSPDPSAVVACRQDFAVTSAERLD